MADSGAEVEFFSGGRASDFLKGESFRVHDIVDDAGPEVRDGEMRGAALWYLRSWRAFKRTRKRTRRLLEERDPDLVVCDEEFSGVTVALETRRRNVFISDELELGFATTPLARVIERRVYSWYKNFQASAERVVVPDYGVDYGNVSHVGPMVRTVTKSKSEVSAEFALPPGNMVLFSMSGSGIGDYLLEKALGAFSRAAIPDSFMAVSGNRGRRLVGEKVFDLGVVRENQNLIAAADLVISTAGKSTIDEAAAAGVPIIAIPIRHHAEQVRNAAALGLTAGDADRLPELISTRMGKRVDPKKFSGVENASALILSMLPV